MRNLSFLSGNVFVSMEAYNTGTPVQSVFEVETTVSYGKNLLRHEPIVLSGMFIFERGLDDVISSLANVERSGLLDEDALNKIIDADAEEVLSVFGVLECNLAFDMWIVGITNTESGSATVLTIKHYSADDGFLNYFKFSSTEGNAAKDNEEKPNGGDADVGRGRVYDFAQHIKDNPHHITEIFGEDDETE